VVAFGVLGFGAVFESISLSVAVHGLLGSARAKGWSLARYVREAPDPTLKTVLFEDSAALIGLLLASAGLALSEITGSENWDGVASLAIGAVLTIVALLLGNQARGLLLGSAAGPETRMHIRETLASFPEVENVVRVLTMQLGSHSVLVTGELRVHRGMNTDEIEDLMVRIDAEIERRVPEVSDTFWELKRSAITTS
jgi:divalent metal cation (Fe/Co/Zn/Cd) transporter